MQTVTPHAEGTTEVASRGESLAVYFALGVVLGVTFLKSEVASWFRIQEMFRFQAFHMYGVIGGAVAVGTIGVALLKRPAPARSGVRPSNSPGRATGSPASGTPPGAPCSGSGGDCSGRARDRSTP